MDESQREARRQRILRNSEKRLQKILGVNSPTSSNQPVENSEVKFDNHAVMEERQFQSSQTLFESSEQPEARFRHRNIEQVVHSDVLINNPLFSNHQDIGMVLGESKTKQTTKEESDSYSHSLLIFLAISVITMLNFGLGVFVGDNALIAFIGYEAYRMILKRNSSPQVGGLISSALLLSGIPQDKLSYIFKVIELCKIVFHDLCIYIFVCLICNHVYQTWANEVNKS